MRLLPGEGYAMVVIPGSLVVFKSPMESSSVTEVKDEYWFGRRRWGQSRDLGESEESAFLVLEQMRLLLGELRDGIITHFTSFAISATVCSIGTSTTTYQRPHGRILATLPGSPRPRLNPAARKVSLRFLVFLDLYY